MGIEVFVGLVVLVMSGSFLLSAASRGWGRARSRVELIGGLADSVVVLVLGNLLLPWGALSPWLWLMPVGLVAAGAVLAVLRWSSLPLWRPDRPRWPAIVGLAIRAVLLVLVVLLVVWP